MDADTEPDPSAMLLKKGLSTLINSVKTSNELPSSGTNYVYYNSFPAFQTIMNAQASKILTIIQKCINHQGAKGSVVESFTKRELNDRFESLVEVNDQLLEKIGSNLDEAAGVRPAAASLVVSSAATLPARGGRFGRFTIPGPSNAPSASPNAHGRLRLLTGRQVGRPQLNFSHPPDNSRTAFRPRLRHKPHAIKPLAESLVVETTDGTDFDQTASPHPYQTELEQFQPTEAMMMPRKEVKTSKLLNETTLTFVKTKTALEELVKVLKEETEIAVDLEAHSYRSYLGITCLMQLSTWTNDFIVDTLALWDDMELMNEVFADPRIMKVFHDASSDVLWLQRDFGIYVVNLYDTSIAAKLLGESRIGLAHLLRSYCDVSTDKKYQLADWRVRPLPEPMVHYARIDTHYLLEICSRQRRQFVDRGRSNQISVVWNRSRERCLTRYQKPMFTDTSYREVYYNVRKAFNAQQLYALRALFNWRDEVARLEDESTACVLPNHMLIMICDTLPREHAGIFACCNPIPSLVRKYIHDIHKHLCDAREIDVSAKTEETKPQMKAQALSDSSGILPHDLSHTEAHEPATQLDDGAVVNVVQKLSKMDDKPIIRLRAAGGGIGAGSALHDPLSQYRLASLHGHSKVSSSKADEVVENGVGRKDQPPPPPPVPITMPPPSPPPPPPPPPSDAERFQLQKASKRKKRKRKAREGEAVDKDEQVEETPPSTALSQTEIQPFDYSKAKLPRSDGSKAKDRMMNTVSNFGAGPRGGGSKGKKAKRGGKKR